MGPSLGAGKTDQRFLSAAVLRAAHHVVDNVHSHALLYGGVLLVTSQYVTRAETLLRGLYRRVRVDPFIKLDFVQNGVTRKMASALPDVEEGVRFKRSVTVNGWGNGCTRAHSRRSSSTSRRSSRTHLRASAIGRAPPRAMPTTKPWAGSLDAQ